MTLAEFKRATANTRRMVQVDNTLYPEEIWVRIAAHEAEKVFRFSRGRVAVRVSETGYAFITVQGTPP